ncbi:alpha/beta fold hydrolase [Desulfosarcina sp.]|uniref:alpha/beta fold hydrolase n=1 Tax=Desulfosarcina sp. TaxID=2027861 RepID=UPI003970B79A
MKDIAFREKELKRWERIFPEGQTIRLSSVGHFAQEEAPDELAEAVLHFLRGTALATTAFSPTRFARN